MRERFYYIGIENPNTTLWIRADRILKIESAAVLSDKWVKSVITYEGSSGELYMEYSSQTVEQFIKAMSAL